MIKEAFVIVGVIATRGQVMEISDIAKVFKVSIRIQDLNKEVY